MTGHAILGLLMTAALLGAPSSASAADNELRDPAVADEATDGVVPGVLLAGLGFLAGITLIGTPMLVAMRRRSPREKDSLPATAETTAATLQRRTLRRAKIRMEDDDPILVSMGFGSSEGERSAARKHSAAGRRPDRTPPT